jgi:catechol 2,3-dioxygenase-like lactoylglutathione lyase family enzyme
MIPVMIVRDMAEALGFYTGVLDFELAFAMPPEAPFYAVLTRDADELHLQLQITGGKQPGHGTAILVCTAIDALFARFTARGLSNRRADSPVHAAPLDQTWGTREFYVDDPSDNTLVFQQPR